MESSPGERPDSTDTTMEFVPVSDAPFVVIVTGMAGAGRSTACNVLEDLGFFVIDNLPPRLISRVLDANQLAEISRTRIAMAVDSRTGVHAFSELRDQIDRLDKYGVRSGVVFLDADNDVLVRRFNETRRPHPVSGATLAESIALERDALSELRGSADVLIDTSNLNVHELRERLSKVFADEHGGSGLNVSITSFGFKHGAPRDADMVLDVRFLANPHWEPQLRPLTGQDHAVSDYVLSSADAGEFLERTVGLINFLLPRYRAEGKSYVSIGIGCTGGRHRSVAIAEYLGKQLGGDVDVIVQHRDI